MPALRRAQAVQRAQRSKELLEGSGTLSWIIDQACPDQVDGLQSDLDRPLDLDPRLAEVRERLERHEAREPVRDPAPETAAWQPRSFLFGSPNTTSDLI